MYGKDLLESLAGCHQSRQYWARWTIGLTETVWMSSVTCFSLNQVSLFYRITIHLHSQGSKRKSKHWRNLSAVLMVGERRFKLQRKKSLLSSYCSYPQLNCRNRGCMWRKRQWVWVLQSFQEVGNMLLKASLASYLCEMVVRVEC